MKRPNHRVFEGVRWLLLALAPADVRASRRAIDWLLEDASFAPPRVVATGVVVPRAA